ncbi:MAG: hypothetical protein ARM1_0122 [Candidatus Micrarchaeota archaeon]|nr:MAG: hypothetical protein ARM1_0122 [Candidatus Micrarchaeota archaeon]
MKDNDIEKITAETIKKGGILARLYFDVQDKNKDNLQPLLADLTNNHISKEKGIVYFYGRIDPPIESNGVYVTSAQITMLFSSFEDMINIVMKYTPIALEILEPSDGYKLSTYDIQRIALNISEFITNKNLSIALSMLNKQDADSIKRVIENRVKIGSELIKKINNQNH